MREQNEVLRETFSHIQKRLESDISYFQSLLRFLEKADTINEFLRLKRALIEAIVKSLPLDAYSCPFCSVHFLPDGCKKCPYGEVHGRCIGGEKELPDYEKIVRARDELLKALATYYEGEHYERI